MSETYSSLQELTQQGLDIYRQVMQHVLDDSALDLSNPALARPVHGSNPFTVVEFATAKEMAAAVIASLGKISPQSQAANTGLWAWLTFVMRDQLFAKEGGVRKVTEFVRWYPAPPGDFQKAQRHLVRMPVLALSSMGDVADHLICGKPRVGPDIREQLTSQQDMFSPEFQKVCRKLYFDDATGNVKKGTGRTEGPGVPRRMAAIRKQLDVTWDMTDLSADKILALLPGEFDEYKRSAADA